MDDNTVPTTTIDLAGSQRTEPAVSTTRQAGQVRGQMPADKDHPGSGALVGPREDSPASPQEDSGGNNGFKTVERLMDVNLRLMVELGRTQLSVRQVLDLQKGTVVELNRIAGDSVDIYVNDHLFARGDVVVVDDKFGVRIVELVSPAENGGKDLRSGKNYRDGEA